jgi:hypothetical protein
MSPQNQPRQFRGPPRMLVLVLFAVLGLLWGNRMANQKRSIQPPVRATTMSSPTATTQP